MTDKKKRGRPPGSGKKKEVLASKIDFKHVTAAAYDAAKLLDTIIDEHPMYIDASKKGTLVVTDPLVAASLARNPRNADHQNHIPFPEDWDKMGKVDKLKWLTEHRKYAISFYKQQNIIHDATS